MSGRNFSLTSHLSAFVDRQVESGRHRSASEVVREALRRYEADLEAERATLEAIAVVAAEGRAAVARGDVRLVRGAEDARTLIEDLMGDPGREDSHGQPSR